MNPITISPPLAHETAERFRGASLALDEVYATLRRRWGALAASWQGQSKEPIEAEVLAALWQMQHLIDRTHALGVELNAVADRFIEADENSPLPVWGVTWSTLPGTISTAAIDTTVIVQPDPGNGQAAGG